MLQAAFWMTGGRGWRGPRVNWGGEELSSGGGLCLPGAVQISHAKNSGQAHLKFCPASVIASQPRLQQSSALKTDNLARHPLPGTTPLCIPASSHPVSHSRVLSSTITADASVPPAESFAPRQVRRTLSHATSLLCRKAVEIWSTCTALAFGSLTSPVEFLTAHGAFIKTPTSTR